MNDQDVTNMAQWLQEILKLLQESQAQATDMRSENRQLMDELKIASVRMEQSNKDIQRVVELLKGQVDTVRSDVLATKNSVESTNNHLDSKMSELKSAIQNIKNIVQ